MNEHYEAVKQWMKLSRERRWHWVHRASAKGWRPSSPGSLTDTRLIKEGQSLLFEMLAYEYNSRLDDEQD